MLAPEPSASHSSNIKDQWSQSTITNNEKVWNIARITEMWQRHDMNKCCQKNGTDRFVQQSCHKPSICKRHSIWKCNKRGVPVMIISCLPDAFQFSRHFPTLSLHFSYHSNALRWLFSPTLWMGKLRLQRQSWPTLGQPVRAELGHAHVTLRQGLLPYLDLPVTNYVLISYPTS